MNIDWHNIAAIATTIVILGGVMVGLMKGFFVTTKNCVDNQDKCQTNICRKLDKLSNEVKEDRELMNTHYAEIKGSLGIIMGKLDD